MDFSAGECVVFGMHGVCTLIGTQVDEKDSSESYVLQPISDKRSRLFVPVNSETACSKMRRIISRETAETLMETMIDAEEIWISNENARKEKYRQILLNGNREELASLIKTLYSQQENQRKAGKRLHRTDEKYYKDAKKILYGELAHVFGVEQADIEAMILEKAETRA